MSTHLETVLKASSMAFAPVGDPSPEMFTARMRDDWIRVPLDSPTSQWSPWHRSWSLESLDISVSINLSSDRCAVYLREPPTVCGVSSGVNFLDSTHDANCELSSSSSILLKLLLLSSSMFVIAVAGCTDDAGFGRSEESRLASEGLLSVDASRDMTDGAEAKAPSLLGGDSCPSGQKSAMP